MSAVKANSPWKRVAVEGASRVRKGSAMTRSAQGTRTSSMAESPRRPLALTKCPLEERAGSR
jgi:hypothetical protein